MKYKTNAIIIFLSLALLCLSGCTQPNQIKPIDGVTGNATQGVQYISTAVARQYQSDISAAEAPYNAEYATLQDKLNKNQIGIDDFRAQAAIINTNKQNATESVKNNYRARNVWGDVTISIEATNSTNSRITAKPVAEVSYYDNSTDILVSTSKNIESGISSFDAIFDTSKWIKSINSIWFVN